MPLTFIDIERQKSWRIALFFVVLLFVYLGVLAAFGLAFLPVTLGTTPRFWVGAGLLALLAAGLHFWFSAYDAVNSVSRNLDARPPDPEDDIHRMFANIIQEIQIVSGAKRTIRCSVIPSFSMNALAVEDLKGNAMIAITEGLLSRLTRPQIEAVAAHEAHHILSGDCLETTVAASIFGTFSSAMEKLNYSSENRTFSLPAFSLAWLFLQLGYLLNMFISREREYRADAAAVRMTRDPLSLAEALHLLSRSWRGAGFIGSGFEMLCIVNPQATVMDETEGFLPDLLSTHPPLKKRMDLLLAMARVSVKDLDRRAEERTVNARRTAEKRFFTRDPQQEWRGPFTLEQLGALQWLSPLSWITPEGSQSVVRAWKDPQIGEIFSNRLSRDGRTVTGLICPTCAQPLVSDAYEGTRIYPCNFCSGTLVENDKIPRIIARTGRERPCSERINALARATLRENQSRMVYHKVMDKGASVTQHLPCPKCKNPMSRGFYSQAHLVEIDRCSSCGLTWFDKDELEMLQCMIENRLVPELSEAGAANEQHGRQERSA